MGLEFRVPFFWLTGSPHLDRSFLVGHVGLGGDHSMCPAQQLLVPRMVHHMLNIHVDVHYIIINIIYIYCKYNVIYYMLYIIYIYNNMLYIIYNNMLDIIYYMISYVY